MLNRFADIASNNLKNQHALFVELLKMFGYALFVVLLAVEGRFLCHMYYESVLLELKEETETKISESVEKAIGLKLHKLQMKLNKFIEEKRFFEDVSYCITML
ncbi:hypothetical protein BHE74_00010079 [Ensete ventricosum]|nr:hypothetical protein BHE74_00010079 [Ensete ventricosum]